MIHRKQSQQGFTLVELMLSMTFISILLLSIAMLTIQISTIYTKGLTLRAVNEAGQQISSDIQKSLNTASPKKVFKAPDPEPAAGDLTGGRFCIGDTVYAWNYGNSLADNNRFNKYSSAKDDPVRLIKFNEDGTEYCKTIERDGNVVYPDLPEQSTDLLSSGDSDLAIHSFKIEQNPVDGDPAQVIYTIQMQIGTNELADMNSTGCTQPGSQIDGAYCAVNVFKFSARAGNK